VFWAAWRIQLGCDFLTIRETLGSFAVLLQKFGCKLQLSESHIFIYS
jgi:hypothetical protein